MQNKAFHNEIRQLQKDSPQSTLVRQLHLFLDEDDLLRMGSRLHNAPIPYQAKFPVLLPRDHAFTNLVIKRAHESVFHSGLQATVTNIRQTYWIPQIRSVVKKFLRMCVHCKCHGGKPFALPVSPPLPVSRVMDAKPFTVSGVDFTGALFVLMPNRSEGKAYICLFTCAATRAVHLEVVTDLTTKTFLHSFRRFAARRSLPSLMLSDNASTYLSAAEEIRKLMKDEEVQAYLGNHRVQWFFIPKRAPWFRGFWERPIGLTKMCLKKVMGRAHITLDELITIVTEIEATLNDRPITYVSDVEQLTPSMLLHGHMLRPLPHQIVNPDEMDDPDFGAIHQRAKRLDSLLQHFQNRWRQEYLTSLLERHRGQGSRVNQIKVGDVVLVHDETPCILWKLAIMRDGLIRSASIKTPQGMTTCPINKLYPLEITTLESSDNKLDESCIISSTPDSHTLSQRPKRQAALQARNTIKGWLPDL